MNKIFLSVASMIVTHFILKIMDKVKGRGPTKEDLYRQMKAEYEARRRAEHDAIQAHLAEFLNENPPGSRFTECAERINVISTPRDGDRLMGAIGTVSELEEALRPVRAVDGCDALAMAPGRFS
jgi:hypothetical protein